MPFQAPPYCPNPRCRYHDPSSTTRPRFHRHGRLRLKGPHATSPRYRCTHCGRTFTRSFFQLRYRDRISVSYAEVHAHRHMGASKRQIARRLHTSEDTVRRRLRKLSRWALLRLARDTSGLRILEPVAYDGLENFSFSQYDPNNVNHAVGKESYFIWDFELAPMNRKGRMSPRQAGRLKSIEREHGRYPGRALEESSKRIFERLLKRVDGRLHLHTDNHRAYRRALRRIPRSGERVSHLITPAKVARNFRNRLFPINHTDMLTRHQLASFKRETIAFAKHPVAMLEDFVLFAAEKNYMRPRFLRPHVRDARAHLESPAMHLGLVNRVLQFHELFDVRICRSHVTLCENWEALFRRVDDWSRRPIMEYAGI